MPLVTDYRDYEHTGDIKYELRYNGDNTVSFVDTTSYQPTTDKTIYVTASYINTTNAAVNDLAALYRAWNWMGSFTPLKDDYVDAEWSGLKKFQMTSVGSDVTFTDVTSYTQVGDAYGAADINATNTLINTIESSYQSGFTQIKDKFTELGIKNVEDMVNGLDRLVTYYLDGGVAQGKKDVVNDPHTYGVYTTSDYNSLRNGMIGQRSTIDGIVAQLDNTETSCTSRASLVSDEIASITGGLPSSDVDARVNSIFNGINLILATENNSVLAESSDSANCADTLMRLII